MAKIDTMPLEMTIGYGTGQPPDRGYSPTGLCDEDTDGKVTDIQKATWAHTGTYTAAAHPSMVSVPAISRPSPSVPHREPQ